MIFDTHMHCDYSCDSHMKIAEAVAAAKQQNIGIVITEHWDDDYPTNPSSFMFDVDEYFERFGLIAVTKCFWESRSECRSRQQLQMKLWLGNIPLTMCWHPCIALMAAICMKNAVMKGWQKLKLYVNF